MQRFSEHLAQLRAGTTQGLHLRPRPVLVRAQRHISQARFKARAAARAAPALVTSKIVNGQVVLTDEKGASPFPAYAQLRVREKGMTTSYFACGGCVVHAWTSAQSGDGKAGVWVLTAAHCTTMSGVDFSIALYAGTESASSSIVTKHTAETVEEMAADGWLEIPDCTLFRHPGYDSVSTKYDVALFRCILPAGTDLPASLTDGTVADVFKLALLPEEAITPNTYAFIMGFGKTRWQGDVSAQMQFADVIVESSGTDLSPFTDNNLPYDSVFHTYASGESTPNGGTVADACQGDSGGPLLSGPIGGPYIVRGIVSWGVECGRPEFPGIYARVYPLVRPAGPFAQQEWGPWAQGIVAVINANSAVQLTYGSGSSGNDEGDGSGSDGTSGSSGDSGSAGAGNAGSGDDSGNGSSDASGSSDGTGGESGGNTGSGDDSGDDSGSGDASGSSDGTGSGSTGNTGSSDDSGDGSGDTSSSSNDSGDGSAGNAGSGNDTAGGDGEVGGSSNEAASGGGGGGSSSSSSGGGGSGGSGNGGSAIAQSLASSLGGLGSLFRLR